jgi:hypothetical protein
MKFDKVPGSNRCVEKKFKLGTRKYEEYKGVRFGDCALVVDVCLHRVDEDISGLTFEEWDPSTDTDSSTAYARRGPQADSRHGSQEVCTLRG